MHFRLQEVKSVEPVTVPQHCSLIPYYKKLFFVIRLDYSTSIDTRELILPVSNKATFLYSNVANTEKYLLCLIGCKKIAL